MRNNLLTLLAKDVDKRFVYSISEVGIFLHTISLYSVGSNKLAGTHVIQRSVCTDRTTLFEISFLADNGGYSTSGQTCCSSPDEDSEFSEELAFFYGRFYAEEMGEDADDGEELVSGIAGRRKPRIDVLMSLHSPLHQGQECRVKCISLLELVCVLAQEQITRIDELDQNKPENFAEVETGDHLLKRLARPISIVAGVYDNA